MKTLVAFYDSLAGAERAVDGMHGESVPPEHISVVAVRPKPVRPDPDASMAPVQFVGDGALKTAGAPTDVGTVMAGLEPRMFASIGEALAMGPLAGPVGSPDPQRPDAPGESHNLTPGLVAAGVPAAEASAYVEALREGGALVMALVKPNKVEAASRALMRGLPLDIHARSQAAPGVTADAPQ